MKLKRNIFVLLIILVQLSSTKGQDVAFSQFYASPLYLNPALAGSKLCPRLTLNYRNQWPNMANGYVTYSATWDNQYNKISGGLGVTANATVGGGGMYNTFNGTAIYSYRLQASRTIVVNAAFQAGYMQRHINWDKFVFGDQLNPYTGVHGETSETKPGKPGIGAVDLSAGILAGYKESVYLGVVVNHLTRPNLSLFEGRSEPMAMKLTVHAGAIIDFFQGMDGEDLRNFSISPNVVYMQQGTFHQLNVGMSVNMYPLVTGLWFRHNFENPDAVIVLFGFQQKQYKIGYSFDNTVSKLKTLTSGAHEISIAWLFNNPQKKHRYAAFRGPSF
ncbi:MAG: PorP/SprF family type IX secretion system membrane protein [Bacteroidetes bacterium]|nr:PorP/SprF family type IX secretion system membrane protein [Bacteroidota bacterium]